MYVAHAFKWGNKLNVIKWVETCYDNTNGQIYFYENIKTQVVVCSCLGDIYMYMTIIFKHLLCNRMADQSQTSWKGNESLY